MTELLAVGEKSFAWIPTRCPVVDGRPGGSHERGGMGFRSERKAPGLVYAGGAWDWSGHGDPQAKSWAVVAKPYQTDVQQSDSRFDSGQSQNS